MRSKAVVLGLYEANGLGVVRSLGQEGIPVIGFHKKGLFPHAAHSRYIEDVHLVENESELLARLMEESKKQAEKAVIFATGDDYVLFCQDHAPELQEHYHVPLVSGGNLHSLLEKRSNLELGVSAGFRVPRSQHLNGGISLEGKIIVKPLTSVDTGKQDIFIFNDRQELERERARLIEAYGNMIIMDYIEGGVKEHFEVHVYNSSRGPLIAGMVQKLLALRNSTHGSIGAIAQSVWVDELATPAIELARLSGFNGAMDINLKQDPQSGEFYFTEVNYRTSGNLMLDTAAGLNLPVIIYLDLNGRDFSHLIREPRTGVKWVSEGVRNTCLQDGLGIPIEEYGECMSGEKVFVFFDSDDPLSIEKKDKDFESGEPKLKPQIEQP